MCQQFLEVINKTLLQYIRKKDQEKKEKRCTLHNKKNNEPFPPRLVQNSQNS